MRILEMFQPEKGTGGSATTQKNFHWCSFLVGVTCAPVATLVEADGNFFDVTTESSQNTPQELLVKAAKFSREGEKA